VPRLRWVLLAVAIVVLVASGALYLSFAHDGRRLEAELHQANAQLTSGQWDQASVSLTRLHSDAARLGRRFSNPLLSVAAHVPYLGRSVRAARAVLSSGSIAASAAQRALPALQTRHLYRAGHLDLAALDTYRAVALQAAPSVDEALAIVAKSPSWPLVGSVARGRALLVDRLSSVQSTLRTLSPAITLAKSVLGSAGKRRYLIAFANPDEMRGASGLWGNYGVLLADDGRPTLGHFGRMEEELGQYATDPGPQWYQDRYVRFGAANDWRQLPTAPDFPAVASIAETDLEHAPGIGPVDGTFAIDPEGLAAFLRATGPVRVPSWPVPVTSTNVVATTLHDAYSSFGTKEQRVSFLSDTARAVWSRLLGADLSPRKLAAASLGQAVAEKHILMHLSRPDEEHLAELLHADGALGDASRTVGVVMQNTSANKMDYWLHRNVQLTFDAQDDGSAQGTATISLRNDGPASGEPRYVIGPNVVGNQAGWNYQLVRLYLPAGTSVHIAGTDADLSEELGFTVVEWSVAIPPGGRVTRSITFDVRRFWEPGSRSVDLTIREQAAVDPEVLGLSVRPPWGWRFRSSGGDCKATPTTTQDIHVRAAASHSLLGWIFGPWARQVTCGNTS